MATPTKDKSDSKPGVIGKGIRIKGQLRGGEDLIIEGKVEGVVALVDNHLILERTSEISANVEVKNITVKGEMLGNAVASDKVEISTEAKMKGDIKAPRLVVEEGAKFRGAVDMEVPLPEGLLDEPATTLIPSDGGWSEV